MIYRTLRESVVIYIKKKIFMGEIKPGDKINEVEISKALNISRGPVREALRQIEQEGLVTYQVNKGCFLKVLSVDDITEIYLIRSKLEILAVNLCNGKYSDEGIKKLEVALDKMKAACDENSLYGIISSDQEFHEAIVKEAKKERLFSVWSSVDAACAAIYVFMYNKKLVSSKVVGNHREMLDVIKSGKNEDICKSIDFHYIVVPEYLTKHNV